MTNADYEKTLKTVPGLADLINEFQKAAPANQKTFLMEFALHGLAEYSLLSKHTLVAGLQFKDLLSSMFNLPTAGEEDETDDEAFGNGKR